MSSLLALADICMSWILEQISKKLKTAIIIYHYVDDLFLAFDNKEDIEKTFQLFNSIHPKIKFTKELENNNQLPFLDIHITKTSKGIETRIFRKKTFTGSYIKWDSYVPPQYKHNLVSTLLDRAFKLCNSYQRMHEEFKTISKILQENGYPKYYIDNRIKIFLNKKFQSKDTRRHTQTHS